MIFRSLFDRESCTYTYVLGNQEAGTAVLFDSVYEQHDRDCRTLEKLGLRLEAVIETHIHADHVTGAARHRAVSGCKIIAPGDPNLEHADRTLTSEQESLRLAGYAVIAHATPGHTAHHYCYEIPKVGVLTGDALLIDACGRTDFQQGDPAQLFTSIHEKIMCFDDATMLYPGHNYKGEMVTTVGEERSFNPRLAGIDKAAFIQIMKGLNLPHPKQIDRAVPANLMCGVLTAEHSSE